MSLPDAPNTLREKYYSVMAGQNDADILPDIETAPSTENRYLDYIARNGGGGGGDVTKAYVDEQDAKKTDKVTSAISGNFAALDSNGNLTDSGKKATDFATASDMSDVQGVIPSTATTQNKLATMADTAGEEISNTATGTSITLTDSADGMVQGLTIYGQSEVVDGEIKSVGDDGLTVTTANSDNTVTTSAEFTTALPLRSTLDGTTRDELIIGNGKAEAITRCEVVDDNIVPLATPVITPLTTAEISAFRGLKTYDSTTNITITDEPDFELDYLKNTDNGQAVSNIQKDLQGQIDGLKSKIEKNHFCYSYKIDLSDSNPATCVKPHFDTRYGCDNFSFTSAKMNYTTGVFDYGSWEGFIRRIARPCMLKYDGTVDYYLDPDDYSKKITGEASDVADVNYQGNAMVELEKLYFKRYIHNGIQYCFIADRKLDKSFKAYAHHDKNGKVLPYIYLAAYNGSYDGTRLRSISDIEYHNLNALTANKIMSNTTRQQEMDFAMANNVQGEAGEGWFIRHKADWDYINTLLILIGMNTNTQATFGNGNISSYVSESNTGILTTGTMNDKGLFYGKNDNVSGVKVFGIENWWGNIWVSIAGWNLVNGAQKIKMSYDQSDVSSVDGFNVTDGTGFATVSNSTPSGTNGGHISDWTIGDFGLIPTVASGASDKRLCDGLWFNNSANCFAFCGGGSYSSVHCGAFCAALNASASYADWGFGAALSYKPLSA